MLVGALLAGAAAAQRAEAGAGAVPDDWVVAPGYAVEVLHTVDAATQGSWVSLCVGPENGDGLGFFAGDQYGAIHEVRLSADGAELGVRRLPTELGHAQGLLWHEQKLFVVVNDGGQSGLYVLDDSDGDALPDRSRKLLALDGDGEHGPHAVVVAPDGEHLLVVCGNHTLPPTELAGSRLAAASSKEGLLDPREWDPNGHARNVMAPGGYVIEVDPNTGAATLVAAGQRNAYDLAVTPTGEVYSFDSDMEWDMGTPWYRPTRLVAIVSGGDGGWRSGSGNWPTWREEMQAPVADVGPGSPTGVLTGAGARFPADDQRSLYLLDWTFGTVHRARLVVSGATHTAQLEPFLTGRGLPLTDGVIGADGSMYLTTGGRGTRSQLLRVKYVGSESTAAAVWPAPNAAAQRRFELERAHGAQVDAAALEMLLATLSDEDRALRFAARVGLEHQELERWAPRLAHLTDATARTLGWLGVLRATSGSASPWVDAALEDLGRLDPRRLTEAQLLVWLRAHQWALIERADTTAAWRERLIARLDALYPHTSAAVNTELVILLVHLEAPGVIERSLDLMDAAPNEAPRGFADHIARNPQYGETIAALIANPPPTEAMRFAFALRQLANGWTFATRERYFTWLQAARVSSGGVSFGGFLDFIESQALATCDATERMQLQPLLVAADASATNGAPRRTAAGPGRAWTVADAEAALVGRLEAADFTRGAELYANYCASCHRLGGSGGSVGPDLTSAAQKFTLHDLVTAIVDPDASVSDQYQMHEWVFADGTRRIARRLGQAADGQLEYLENVLEPGEIGRVSPDDVVSVTASRHSPMAPQLTHGMNASELRDLVAHVASAGGAQRAFGDWQGRLPEPPPPVVVLSSTALRIVLGALIAVVVLVAGIGLLASRVARGA